MIEIYLDLPEFQKSESFQNGYDTTLSRILDEISRIKFQYLTDNGFSPSMLVVGLRVFNFISDSKAYSSNLCNISDEDFNPSKMGEIFDLDVYLDLRMENGMIRLTTDIETVRDMKIQSILYGANIGDKFTVEIKLISDII